MFSLYAFVSHVSVTCMGAVKCSLLVSFHQIFYFYFLNHKALRYRDCLETRLFAPGGSTCSQPAFSYTFPSYTGHENPPSRGGRGLPATCSSPSPAASPATSQPTDQFEFAVLNGVVKMQHWGICKVLPRGRGTWALRGAHGTRAHEATAR